MSGFRITDGTSTLVVEDHTLSTPQYNTMEYTPGVPQPSATELRDRGDGGEVTSVSYANIDETARVLSLGGEDAVRTTFQGFSRMFELARLRANFRKGSRIYQEFRYKDADPWWRSEILHGAAELTDDALGWQQMDGQLQVNLKWRRRFYWEGPEAALPLKLGGTGSSSTSVTVRNNQSGGAYPWFTIDASAIDGDLPCPVRIEMLNTYAGGVSLRALGDTYIARSALIDLTSAPTLLEAESGTAESTSSVLSSSTASGGQVRSWSWTGTATHALLYWSLGSSQITALKAGWYRVLGRITSIASNYWVRLRVTVNANTNLWVSPWSKMNGYTLQELGTVQLPPSSFNSGNLFPVELHIDVRGPSGSTNTLELDYITILPTEGFRTVRQNGYSAPQGVTLIDDTIESELYTLGWSASPTGKLANFVGFGPQMLLIPGITNRFYILTTNEVGGSEIDRTTQVKVYYRPRRKAL